MWARDVEIMIGCWLAMSPFIFGHPHTHSGWWASDLVAALVVIVLAGISYWRPARLAHLGQLLVACWLIGFAYSQSWGLETGAPAAMQNLMAVGLLLLMFGLVPNEAPVSPLSRRRDRAETDSRLDSLSPESDRDVRHRQTHEAVSSLSGVPR